MTRRLYELSQKMTRFLERDALRGGGVSDGDSDFERLAAERLIENYLEPLGTLTIGHQHDAGGLSDKESMAESFENEMRLFGGDRVH